MSFKLLQVQQYLHKSCLIRLSVTVYVSNSSRSKHHVQYIQYELIQT